MQQEGRRIDSSTMVNAGGNVFIGQYDKIIMILVVAVVVVCVVNIIGYCVVIIHMTVPPSLPAPTTWMNAP